MPIITEAVQPIYAENKPAATAVEVLAQSLQDLEVAKKITRLAQYCNGRLCFTG